MKKRDPFPYRPNRSDFPDLETRLRKFVDLELKSLLVEYFGPAAERDVVFTFLLSSIGKRGGTAYVSTGSRDEMISALEELLLNMHAERARGPHEPTVVETLAMLTQAAVRVLEVSEEHVSEEEGMKRFQELANLLGWKGSPKPQPGDTAKEGA
jgi:hypothetical protein